ncbi:MFS transporter [Kutzneria kofuensis]|uniref:MFS family permease n=1 Tax=Kutzneria kofuensis TaxID=103725 RepID=A0A7W9NLA8_9PSEU|nr:MFS transporter [Kutzneria kofuensis]MBB5897487.1 MFS family permease [Kutzneria kofuensis]
MARSEFRWWFGSQVLSASGTITQSVAVSWLVLRLNSNAIFLALVTVCTMAPLIPLGPWAGSLVDHVDRRRLLMLTQTLLAALSLLLGVLTATGAIQLWSLFAISLATGAVSAVDGPARQVFVRDLVGGAGVASAVSLNEVVINVSRVLGPAVGGVLLSTVGVTWGFVANALSFVAPLIVLRQTATRSDRIDRPAREPGAIRAGLRYVRGQPAILACVLLAAATGMLFDLGVALPLLATTVWHLGGAGFGSLMAAFGIGALPGAGMAAATTWPTGRRVRVLAVATGLSAILVGYAPHPIVAYAGMIIAGFASIWFIAMANTLVQVESAPAMRGRVMGVWTMALPGMLPVTSLVAAGITEGLGPRTGFAASGVPLLLTVAAGWRALGRHRSSEDRSALTS